MSPIQHEGNLYIALHDHLGLAKGMVLVPHFMAPLLELCDGTRDMGALRTAFELRTGIPLSVAALEKAVSQLEEALFLEGERFARACDAAREEFRSFAARPPALAGGGYPDDPDDLANMIQEYLAGGTDDGSIIGDGQVRGLISPHIDFQRGGPVYAQVWSKAAQTIQDIELAIVFGTDHLGGHDVFTLTRQNYSTPWGALPTDADIVDSLADAIGREAAFRDELHHKNEHSIELAMVWLHYLLGDRVCRMVPVLCGSFEQFILGSDDPIRDGRIAAATDLLQEVVQSRRTLVVAAADLAHMGPAFGDGFSIDADRRAEITAADERLITAMCSADADGFFAEVRNERNRRRICGLAPIYMAMSVLDGARGDSSGYMHCPADAINASLVSICGVILT